MFQYDTNQFACLCSPRQKQVHMSWADLLFSHFPPLITMYGNHPQAGACSMFPDCTNPFAKSRAKSTTHLGLLALSFACQNFHNLGKELL